MVGGKGVSMDAALQELVAKQAIAEVVARYSRTLDWLDDEGQASCYWPDAAIDYGFFVGTAEAFVPVVMAIERRSARRWHMLNGLIVKLDGPAHASAECYGIATGIREEGGAWSGNMYGGRYLDEFEKRGGEWRISSRRYILDWSHPLPNQPGAVPNPDFPLPILSIVESGHPDYRRL
jgi:hypothetical protein